jgi:hypothetical protein
MMIDAPDRADTNAAVGCARHELRGHEKDFAGRAPIDVHLIIHIAASGDLNETRREDRRNGRRRE